MLGQPQTELNADVHRKKQAEMSMQEGLTTAPTTTFIAQIKITPRCLAHLDHIY